MRPEQVLDMQADLDARLHQKEFRRMTQQTLAGSDSTVPSQFNDKANTEFLMDAFTQHVRLAYAYRVTEDMSRLVEFAASKLDDSDRWDHHLAPTDWGIVRFEKGLPLQDVRGKQMLCHWLTWGPISAYRTDAFGQTIDAPGTLLTWWNDIGTVADEVWLDIEAKYTPKQIATVRRIAGRWAMDGGEIVVDGERLGAPHVEAPEREYLKLIEQGVDPLPFTNTRRYAHALFLLLEQTLTDVTEEAIPRAAQKRIGKMPIPGRVSVVTLRRKAGARSQGESTVQWSHRWLVRGYWKWQPYGHGLTLRKRIWIDPGIRGPADKPLWVTNKVYNLSR